MLKEQLLQECTDAFERLIETANDATQHSVTRQEDMWGPREIVAHLAGWEVLAGVRISQIVAGMSPFEFNETPQIADAINTLIVTMVGDQSLDILCSMLRRSYQQNGELLRKLDDTFFQPGEYVYERTTSVIEHCQEHIQQLTLSYP